MKYYFKYGSGYINIDSENLYLTNTGNWQEARGLHEKSAATVKANNTRINKMKAYVYSLLGAVGCFFLLRFEDEKITIGGFVFLAALAWGMFEYFKSDFGNQYKIPIAKITAIEKYEKGLKISFLNAVNQADVEIVNNVDPVGIAVLTQLKIIKYDLGIS